MVEILKKRKFRNYEHVVRYQRPQMGSKVLGGITIDTWAPSEPILGSSLFQYGQKKNLKRQDFEMLRKTRKRA